MELIIEDELAHVDNDQAALVDHFKWSLLRHKRGRTYAYARVAGHRVYMHHLVLNHTPRGRGGGDIDHINGDGLDNRRENLRPATRSQNNANGRSHEGSTSRYKGVSWSEQGRVWQVHISPNGKGKSKSLGRYANEDDAAHAYDLAAVEVFGEFARLNLPDRIDEPAPARFSARAAARMVAREIPLPTSSNPPKEGRQGATHPGAKLTEDDVRTIIRELQVVPRRSQASIAADFGVSQVLVGRIKNRKSWAHLWAVD